MPITDGMAAYHDDLYEEHLEEAAFLFEQRVLLSDDPEVDWPEVADEEARLEAHLDALRIGGPLSQKARQAAMEADDPGLVHALTSLFCLEGDQEGLLAYLDARPLDREGSHALFAALLAHAPRDWQDPLARTIADRDEPIAEALLRYAALRCPPASPHLFEELAQRQDLFGALALARAGCGLRAAIPDLFHLADSDGSEAMPASLALLCLGDRRQLDDLERGDDPVRLARFAITLGIAGRSIGPLLRARRSGQNALETLLGLGFFGEPAAVAPLIEALDDPDLAEAAAMALYLITGFAEREEVFVPEEPDEDENTEQDPPGEMIQRLSRSPEAWRDWWRAHETDFDRGRVYRLGEPISADAVLESLAAPATPNRLRRWIVPELQIRYGGSIALDIALPVARQQQLLAKARAELVPSDGEPGHRMLFGKPI